MAGFVHALIFLALFFIILVSFSALISGVFAYAFLMGLMRHCHFIGSVFLKWTQRQRLVFTTPP